MERKKPIEHTQLLVLSLLAGEDMYGYQMILELARRSDHTFEMKEGTLYPVLHGLERDGAVEAYQQEAPTGRMRKYYRLTRKGRELLAEKKAAYTELRKAREFRDQVETQQLTAVAKKYELLGKKPEELVPLLKSLKAAGGTAYDDMISVLDSNLAAIEKSGVFSEIGKRGTESGAGDNAWGKIEAAAQEIIKSKPGMRWADAVDAACLAHPELVQEYEKSR